MKIKRLIKDLKKLNKKYNALNPTHYDDPHIMDKEEDLLNSGRLIIDFYKNTFIPKYSRIENPKIQEAEIILYNRSLMAEQCISKNDTAGLVLLLMPKGSRFSDPNDLEDLIKNLKDSKD